MSRYQKIIGTAGVLALLLTAGTAFAQTYTNATGTMTSSTTGTDTSSTTPGTPNTGAGGDAMQNILLLGTSALVALAGAAYIARRPAQG